MNRSTEASRIASSRICVPSTFVVTNSDAPSSIDFSTWDSAAALTITSTSLTTSRTSSRSRMSPWTNESRGCAITSARFSRLPAYVSASTETTSYGVASSRWRTKLEEMNPAPPVTSTRFELMGRTLSRSGCIDLWVESPLGGIDQEVDRAVDGQTAAREEQVEALEARQHPEHVLGV